MNELLFIGKGKKTPWKDNERAAVLTFFNSHIITGKIPVKREVDACIAKNACLRKRPWRNIKDFVRNKIKSKSKKLF